MAKQYRKGTKSNLLLAAGREAGLRGLVLKCGGLSDGAERAALKVVHV